MQKNRWTKEVIRDGLDRFFEENKRYPTTREIDACKYLPSSRQIQRRFSGVVKLRGDLNLPGPTDFTKGAYSSQRAKNINIRAHELEKVVYDFLVGRFGKTFVHRESFSTDDHRTKTDFFVHCKSGNFSVDVFYPKDRFSFVSCLNSKMHTYGYGLMTQFPVIFLMLNDDFSETDMERAIEGKKNKLKPNQFVMKFNQFVEFCKDKIPYEIKE